MYREEEEEEEEAAWSRTLLESPQSDSAGRLGLICPRLQKVSDDLHI